MGNSIEQVASDSDEGIGMYSESSDEAEKLQMTGISIPNELLMAEMVDDDDRTRDENDPSDEWSISSTTSNTATTTKHARVSVYVAPLEAAALNAEKKVAEAARLEAAKERQAAMPLVTDYSLPALAALVRLDELKVRENDEIVLR
jgi:hypothetical protein